MKLPTKHTRFMDEDMKTKPERWALRLWLAGLLCLPVIYAEAVAGFWHPFLGTLQMGILCLLAVGIQLPLLFVGRGRLHESREKLRKLELQIEVRKVVIDTVEDILARIEKTLEKRKEGANGDSR